MFSLWRFKTLLLIATGVNIHLYSIRYALYAVIKGNVCMTV